MLRTGTLSLRHFAIFPNNDQNGWDRVFGSSFGQSLRRVFFSPFILWPVLLVEKSVVVSQWKHKTVDAAFLEIIKYSVSKSDSTGCLCDINNEFRCQSISILINFRCDCSRTRIAARSLAFSHHCLCIDHISECCSFNWKIQIVLMYAELQISRLSYSWRLIMIDSYWNCGHFSQLQCGPSLPGNSVDNNDEIEPSH